MFFSIEYIIILALIGVFAGFVSGLLGVGGGFLIVPLQFFLLTSFAISPDIAMLISLATSLAIIIPTSLSGAYRHSKTMDNIFKPGVKLGIFGIFGGFIGAFIASSIDSTFIRFIFALFLIFLAIYNLVSIDKNNTKTRIKFNLTNSAIIGVIVGFLSGLLGIGGGIFIIIALTLFFGFSLLKSISISSIFIVLTAIGGTVSYILSGWGVNTLPFSLGYVSLINFIGIIIFSVPSAYLGANYAYNLPEKSLKIVFAILLLVIGFKMIGVF